MSEGVWSGIYPPDQTKPCDICGSDKDVHHETIKVETGGCVRSVFSHVQSSLCLTCKFTKGWMVFRSAGADGKVTYYNPQTNEFKNI